MGNATFSFFFRHFFLVFHFVFDVADDRIWKILQFFQSVNMAWIITVGYCQHWIETGYASCFPKIAFSLLLTDLHGCLCQSVLVVSQRKRYRADGDHFLLANVCCSVWSAQLSDRSSDRMPFILGSFPFTVHLGCRSCWMQSGRVVPPFSLYGFAILPTNTGDIFLPSMTALKSIIAAAVVAVVIALFACF